MSEPFGRYLLNRKLPTKYQIKGAVGKGDLKRRLNELAKEDPDTYVRAVTSLKETGDNLATWEGLSVGLDDISPQYGARDAALAPYKRRFRNATSDKQKANIAAEAQGIMISKSVKHPGELTLQVQSGARGKPLQYANMVGAVGGARDVKGGMVPWLITKSYSEGLSPADYYAATNQSMMDVVKTNTLVSEPGELNKKLISVMNDSMVTEVDCGTDNGIMMDPREPDAIDRYVARNTGNIKRNTLVTPNNQGNIAKAHKEIMLRSPMTCEAADGVCQRCQGLDEKGNNHTIGVNVGSRSASAMSEPLTQFALDAKHGGRNLQADKSQVHGIAGFRQIIETPKQFVNKAAISTRDGKVTRIEKAPQGGHYVYIDDAEHYAAPDMGIKVRKGDKIQSGDVLSEGVPKPDEVVRYKGLGPGRLYMVKTLKDLYKSQGKNLDSRHFEHLAKSNMNHVRILDDPSNKFIKGDIVNFNNLRSELARSAKMVPLKDSLGETLGKGVREYTAGTRVTPYVLKKIKETGIKDVPIAQRAPQIEFVMKSATNVPRMHPDWIARMGHRGLKRSILQAAHTAETSDLHGTHPIPAYIHGATFGEGPGGRY